MAALGLGFLSEVLLAVGVLFRAEWAVAAWHVASATISVALGATAVEAAAVGRDFLRFGVASGLLAVQVLSAWAAW